MGRSEHAHAGYPDFLFARPGSAPIWGVTLLKLTNLNQKETSFVSVRAEKETERTWTQTTMNGTQPIELLQQSYSRKNRKNLCWLPDFSCFAGWKHRHRNNYPQDENMRKPINFLIVNMAISDLLLPIFLIPREVQGLYVDSWLIGGPPVLTVQFSFQFSARAPLGVKGRDSWNSD